MAEPASHPTTSTPNIYCWLAACMVVLLALVASAEPLLVVEWDEDVAAGNTASINSTAAPSEVPATPVKGVLDNDQDNDGHIDNVPTTSLAVLIVALVLIPLVTSGLLLPPYDPQRISTFLSLVLERPG